MKKAPEISNRVQLTTMLLLELPNEILHKILDGVKPRDFENFTLSCKFIRELAGERLEEHPLLKIDLTKVYSGDGPFRGHRLPELLDRILVEPRTADYINEPFVRGCRPCWEQPRDGEDSIHRRYLDGRMKAFEKAVKDTDYIPSADKEGWISKVHAGDEDPLLSLLFTQLHCLTSVKLIMDNERSVLFEILKGIVEDPRSLSLSQLQHVAIYGNSPNQHLELAVCFAALPSVISLTARHINERASVSEAIIFDLPPHSSNVRELNLDHCESSIATASILIAATKSLRSFQCDSYTMAHDPLFANMLTTLQQHASSSLEELSIRCSEDVVFDSQGRILGNYMHLRLLTIKYVTTVHCRPLTTDVMTTFLPASVEILNFVEPDGDSFAWFQAMVESIVNMKMKTRTIRALRQLNIKETFLSICCPSQTRDMYLEAAEAGIRITSVPYDDLVASLRRR